MSEPFFLGLDAGGSKTVCLVGDRQATLGRGEAGPANPRLAGVDGFRAAIAAAAANALGATDGSAPAALSTPRPLVAWIGVAGGEAPAIRRKLRAAARDALNARNVWISHDGRLLLAAAGLGSGIALVAGTGSSVYGRSVRGGEVRVGGWGHLLGDEGSGYDIACQALRAVTQAADGRGPRTLLSEAIPAALGVSSVNAVRDWLYPAPPVAEVARLAAAVLDLSDRDAVADGLVAAAADELAVAVRTCRAQLDRAPERNWGDSEGLTPVVVAGGLMGTGSPLLRRLAAELEGRDGYRVVPLTVEPAVGALALARDGPAPAEEEPEEDQLWKADEQVQQEPKESLR